MILETKDVNGVVQATILPEEASLSNAEQFKEEMISLVAGGSKLVMVSFENVNYIDSSFLGSLVVALKYAIPRKVDIYLVSLKSDVGNLLTLIRMDKVFKIFKDYEQAMESLG
ncbi:STAS domain-containing protein [Dyadobacter sandarakinus]|uniref:STAS domain-containing protein n=1 Tax=Dyadobacter sandarakinus TaxID=2747268 RepID=A0ABX7I164_9BACT|nr:STAS domain-containing protein [Dyadobacter sandarakinus]QRQ99579.1 STAS domain-containing protein [Dyadobacter sandarakinus]